MNNEKTTKGIIAAVTQPVSLDARSGTFSEIEPQVLQHRAIEATNVPVKQFWSITLYDTETRCFIDTPHNFAGVDSRGNLIQNADGSVDLYFGPTAPPGKETNWAPTVPGRSWFAYFRFYAPTEPHFDRSWSCQTSNRGRTDSLI